MRLLKFLPTIAALTLASVLCSAQVDAKKVITAYYAKTDALTLKKDMAGLSKLLTDATTTDFVSIEKPNSAGTSVKRTRKDALEMMAKILPLVDKFDKAATHIDKLTTSKSSIVVTVSTTVAITTNKGPDGKVHKLLDIGKSDDTWVKVGQSWKLKLSKTITETMTENGKPIPTG